MISDGATMTTSRHVADRRKKMKALIGVVMMCVAGGAVAADESKLVRCTSYAELAQQVMEARQIGVPLGDLIKTSTNADLFTPLFMLAYDEPAYRTEENQNRAISEFYADQFIACMKG